MSGRLPPHNLDAETAVLGTMLVTTAALETALDIVDSADFYRPIHGAIFAAMAQLHADGQPADVTTVGEVLRVSGDLEAAGGLMGLRTLLGNAPLSSRVAHYAKVVSELAALRRGIELCLQGIELGYEGDIGEMDRFLAEAPARLAAPIATVPPPIEASALAALDFPHRWLVEGLLERQDVGAIVGAEGHGKSLSLRQWCVQFASGVHPFSLEPIDPIRCLIVDCENTEAQVARSLQWLLGIAGDRYAGTLWIENHPQGLDLTTTRDGRWLEAKIDAVRPDLLVIGPLYKLYRGSEGRSKHSEEAAEHVTNVIDALKVRFDLAVLIEAHAPWAQGQNLREFRIRGSAAWTGWVGFSLGLVPVRRDDFRREVKVLRPVRGDRDTGRQWPKRLIQGPEGDWPWIDPDRKPSVAAALAMDDTGEPF